MKPFIAVLIALLFALFFYLLPQPVPEPSPDSASDTTNSFVIGPVQLFDGDNWQEDVYLEVQDGWVQHWHNQAPNSDLTQIDGKGYWLLPGLIDAHVHAWGDALAQNLRFGVSTVLDQFGQPDFLNQQQAQHSSTEPTTVADMFGAGTLATVAGGHGTQYGFAIPVLSGPEDAEPFVLARKAEGSHWIKIVYRSEQARQAGQPSLDLPTVSALIQTAQRHGLMALVHIEDQNSALEAIQAGANGLVHGFFDAPVSDEFIAAMQANGSFMIPTLVVMEGFLQHSINQELLLSDPADWLTPAMKHKLQQRLNFGAKNPRAFAQLQQNVKRLFDAGIPILAGSDAPNPNTDYGVSLVVEMELLRRAGLPVDAVLHSATGLTARQFQLPAQGHLKPGAKADFLLLANDPRNDFTELLQPEGIWKHGWRLPEASATAKPELLLPGVVADFRQSEQPVHGVFMASDDRVMLGKSHASLQWHPQLTMRVQGALLPGFTYPWAGLSWLLTGSPDQGADLSGMQTLRFRIRGTPGQYRLDAFSAGSWMPSSHSFAVTQDWQWVELSLADFQGLDPAAISMLSWIGPAGDFQFELEQIELE